ncbi:MAG TPA: nuclear transport factor 2 family protein [Sphingomonas sp.]|nr:nuclear transport factor 2 family protein [Sphingomonas sp.]
MNLPLEEIERIKQLKYAYARSIDTCDAERLATLFTEDAEVDYRGGSYRFQAKGRDAIVAAIAQSFHAELVASHTVHMPEIQVHDDGAADGLWTLLDYVLDLRDGKTTVGAAHYRDRYVKREGRWLIRRAEYDRVYERVYTERDVGLTAHMLATIHAAR